MVFILGSGLAGIRFEELVFVDEDVRQDGGDCSIVRRQVLDVLLDDEMHSAGRELDGGDVLGGDLGTPIVD